MSDYDYWEDCIAEAFEDAGIKATDKQVSVVAGWAESGHDHFHQHSGHDSIPNPLMAEIAELKRKLKREEDKLICGECDGSGEEVTHGPYHSSCSSCYKCNGSGFIYI